MFNLDILQRAHWADFYNFFMSGQPPIILRLLLLNTIFMVYVIIKRIRAKRKIDATSSLVVQGLLIVANFAVMLEADLLHSVTWLRGIV
jgi:fumarate reductase subunit C